MRNQEILADWFPIQSYHSQEFGHGCVSSDMQKLYEKRYAQIEQDSWSVWTCCGTISQHIFYSTISNDPYIIKDNRKLCYVRKNKDICSCIYPHPSFPDYSNICGTSIEQCASYTYQLQSTIGVNISRRQMVKHSVQCNRMLYISFGLQWSNIALD